MTEKEFLYFLKMKLEREKMPQSSGYVSSSDREIKNLGKYAEGHSVLFKGHQMLSTKMITEMGHLLLKQHVGLQTKEALLVILAHHPSSEALSALSLYSVDPDEDLRYFARIALDECGIWNE
ncbi:MAG: hypothetical protein Q7S30_02905 [Candidatus Omnitrophota bacterium]|nr:hypothetical protein [Candidatus Omnitrophota bacterium]